MVAVNFTPTVVGNPVLGSVNVSSDASNSPGVIELSGQVLDVDPATIVLTSSVNPSVTGSSVTFSVVVSSVGTTPTGTITLLDGTTTLATGQLGPGGNITFSISTLTAGNHSMTAAYAGDSNNAAGVSTSLVQVVQDPVANTTTTLSTSSNPVFAGAALTLTAQVQPAVTGSGKGSIAGTVTFKYGSQQLGSANVTNGVASITYNTLPVGGDVLIATYGGSSTYGTSSSSPLTQNVQIATTRTVLTTSANPSPAGAALTLTAAVSGNGGIPGGTLTFFDGSVNLGTATLNAQGIATLSVSGANWTVGTHSLTATYAGDAADSASTSSPVSETIALATTAVKLASSLNPAALSAAVTLSANVTGNGGTPAGTVTFFDGAAGIGSATLNAQGIASLTVSNLIIGSHNITAAYSGDASDAAATSTILTQVIQPASIAASLNSSVKPGDLRQSPHPHRRRHRKRFHPGRHRHLLGRHRHPRDRDPHRPGHCHARPLQPRHRDPLAHRCLLGRPQPRRRRLQHPGPERRPGHLHHPRSHQPQPHRRHPGYLYRCGSPEPTVKPTTGPIALYDGKTLMGTVTPNTSGVATMSGVYLAPGAHTLTATFAGDTLDATSTSAPINSNVTIATTAAHPGLQP